MKAQNDARECNVITRPIVTASRLFDQQMWCFGQDICNPQGNLLVRFGFARHRQPATKERVSAYSLNPEARSQIVLWGFGLFYGEEGYGGMFLRRFQFRPTWTAAPALTEIVWGPDKLPDLRVAASRKQKACVRRLLAEALSWLAHYEGWVIETVGLAYRQQCVQRWPKAVLDAGSVPDEWRRQAARWEMKRAN